MKAIDQLKHHRAQMMLTRDATPLERTWNPASLIKLTNKRLLAEAFLNDSDERKPCIQGATKPIHTIGTSGFVRYDPTPFGARKYTGIFRSGGVGIIRLSSAGPAMSGNFIPGMAMKIFVDHSPSVNFHALYSLDGQGSDMFFFRHSLHTSVSPPQGWLARLLAWQFQGALSRVSPFAFQRPVDALTLPLTEAASITSSGCIQHPALAPQMLTFVPRVPNNVPCARDTDFREYVARHVKAPTLLYEVRDQHRNLIGDVILVEDFIVSKHGEAMAFKHQQVPYDA